MTENDINPQENVVIVYPSPENESKQQPLILKMVYVAINVTPDDILNEHVVDYTQEEIISCLRKSWDIKKDPIYCYFKNPENENELKHISVRFDENGKLRKSSKRTDDIRPAFLPDADLEKALFTVERVDSPNALEFRIQNGSYFWRIVHSDWKDSNYRSIQPERADGFDDTYTFKVVEYVGHAKFNGHSSPIRLVLIASKDGDLAQVTSSTNIVLDMTKGKCLKKKYIDCSLMDSRFFAHVQAGDLVRIRLLQPIIRRNQLLALDGDKIVLHNMRYNLLTNLSPNQVRDIMDGTNEWIVNKI